MGLKESQEKRRGGRREKPERWGKHFTKEMIENENDGEYSAWSGRRRSEALRLTHFDAGLAGGGEAFCQRKLSGDT